LPRKHTQTAGERLWSTPLRKCRRYFSDYEPYDAFLFHAQEELAGISIAGKEVLEIGCGRGVFLFYLALSGGAEKVIMFDEAED